MEKPGHDLDDGVKDDPTILSSSSDVTVTFRIHYSASPKTPDTRIGNGYLSTTTKINKNSLSLSLSSLSNKHIQDDEEFQIVIELFGLAILGASIFAELKLSSLVKQMLT